MAIEHQSIPEDGLHEPKGASLSPASRVYIADGAGSGSWSQVDADSLQGTVNNTQGAGLRVVLDGSGGFSAESVPESYGVMALNSNTTTVASTAAADSTLASNSDYTEVNLGFVFEELNSVGSGANFLTASDTGTYKIDFWANAKTDQPSTILAVKLVINDIDFASRRPKKSLQTANEIDNMSSNGIISLTSGDSVKIYLATTTTCNVTIEDMALSLHMLESA